MNKAGEPRRRAGRRQGRDRHGWDCGDGLSFVRHATEEGGEVRAQRGLDLRKQGQQRGVSARSCVEGHAIAVEDESAALSDVAVVVTTMKAGITTCAQPVPREPLIGPA